MKRSDHSSAQRLLALFMVLAIAMLPQMSYSATTSDLCEVPTSSSPIMEEEIPHACAICFSPTMPKAGVQHTAIGPVQRADDARCLHHGEVAVPPPRTH